jgi:hypothetical protein
MQGVQNAGAVGRQDDEGGLDAAVANRAGQILDVARASADVSRMRGPFSYVARQDVAIRRLKHRRGSSSPVSPTTNRHVDNVDDSTMMYAMKSC